MIRRTTINLNYATRLKKSQLDLIFAEYKRVVNVYIDNLWQNESLNKFVDFKVETWLSARMQQLAGKVATQIVRSVRKKDKSIRYNRYKKIYVYFKNRNRQKVFLNKKYSELYLKYKIKPVFKKNLIEMDSRFISIESGNNAFDIWLKIGSIGNKIQLVLPSKQHSHLRRYNDWVLKKCIKIYQKESGYFADLYFEKVTPESLVSGKEKAIDVGINKLICSSDGQIIGTEIKPLIQKLHRRKQKSKNWYQTIEEIKNYIGNSVNKLDLNDTSLLVMEKLTGLSNKKSTKNNKTTRKLLGYWNRKLLETRIELKCQINRVGLVKVNPAYTSQECPACHHIANRNRQGENFKCVKCGHIGDADSDIAPLNILDRYRESIVLCACKN